MNNEYDVEKRDSYDGRDIRASGVMSNRPLLPPHLLPHRHQLLHNLNQGNKNAFLIKEVLKRVFCLCQR